MRLTQNKFGWLGIEATDEELVFDGGVGDSEGVMLNFFFLSPKGEDELREALVARKLSRMAKEQVV